MTTRKQHESFLLGFILVGLASFSAVIIGSLATTVDAATGSTTTVAIADDVVAEASSPARGPGSGAQGAAEPLSFGRASQDVLDAFTAGGCVACHSIKGVGGEAATIGPPLMRTGAIAAARRPGPTVEDYIRTSILDPDAFIMPNCPTGPCSAGLMPQTLADTLSADQIETIVSYLAVLGTDGEAGVLSASGG